MPLNFCQRARYAGTVMQATYHEKLKHHINTSLTTVVLYYILDSYISDSFQPFKYSWILVGFINSIMYYTLCQIFIPSVTYQFVFYHFTSSITPGNLAAIPTPSLTPRLHLIFNFLVTSFTWHTSPDQSINIMRLFIGNPLVYKNCLLTLRQ